MWPFFGMSIYLHFLGFYLQCTFKLLLETSISCKVTLCHFIEYCFSFLLDFLVLLWIHFSWLKQIFCWSYRLKGYMMYVNIFIHIQFLSKKNEIRKINLDIILLFVLLLNKVKLIELSSGACFVTIYWVFKLV